MEDLGHVSQVESVVRLDWNWLELILNTVVDNKSSINNILNVALDIILECTKVSSENLVEDHLDGCGIKGRVS